MFDTPYDSKWVAHEVTTILVKCLPLTSMVALVSANHSCAENYSSDQIVSSRRSCKDDLVRRTSYSVEVDQGYQLVGGLSAASGDQDTGR